MLTLATTPAWTTAPIVLALKERVLGGSPGPDFTRYLLVSGGLVVGVALLGIGFRRWIGARWVARAAQRSLRVLDILPLGQRQRVAVVRCFDRTMLLGLGEREVTLLCELDGEHGAGADPAPALADALAFQQQLERASRAGQEGADAPSPVQQRQQPTTPPTGWVG